MKLVCTAECRQTIHGLRGASQIKERLEFRAHKAEIEFESLPLENSFDIDPVTRATRKGLVDQKILRRACPEFCCLGYRPKRTSRDRAILKMHGSQSDIHMSALCILEKQHLVSENELQSIC